MCLSELETKVLGLLSSEDEFEQLMGDVLRVLALYNGVLWSSELHRELFTFHNALGEKGIEDIKNIDTAVSKLAEMEILKTDERLKASLADKGFTKELLIFIANQEITRNIVLKDPKLKRFIEERERIFGKLLKKKK